jgi:membrane protein implicated in regulation of membrane protease activity
MDHTYIWLVIGIVLVIAELVTGTFYLLFLGIAAIVGAAVAYLGAPFWAQAIVSAIVLTIGVVWIQRHKRMQKQPGMPNLDVGQPVKWESWISQSEGEKQAAINRAQGEGTAIRVVAEAKAAAIRVLAESLGVTGGMSAANLKIAEAYADAFSNVAKTYATLILPSNLSDIAGPFASAMTVLDRSRPGAVPPPMPRG